jgi:hypothetical protein
MTDKTRLRLTFTVSSDYVTISRLKEALGGDRGRWWLRHALGDALERVLHWSVGGHSWRVKVEGGSVVEIKEGDA